MLISKRLLVLFLAALLLGSGPFLFAQPGSEEDDDEEEDREGSFRDQVIYFVMPDRFYNADPGNDLGDYQPPADTDPHAPEEILKHGHKKDHKAYYHGGDLRGLIAKLDYLQELGITALWITPIFHNKAVQGQGTIESSSAAYHGYWIKNFLEVDPHLGSTEDLEELVRRAHQRDMKVYLDIITNHTADIIRYQDFPQAPYRSKAEYPFRDSAGQAFDDLDYAFSYRDGTPFPALNLQSFPYSPYVPQAEAEAKIPSWLNNPLYYHNRGNTTFSGENSVYGDFFGLDDLFTAHPQVVGGMIDIYQHWIGTYGIDGFRVDTVKHVNLEFWQQFTPQILRYARDQEIPDFYLFGEVYEGNPEVLSLYTTAGRLPAVLDFGFQGAAAAVFSSGKPTDTLRSFFQSDDYYSDADSSVYDLPTFLGNHDMGRIGAMIYRDNPNQPEEQLLARSVLAHALLFTARGVPTVYYGDEQGFTGVEPTEEGSAINDQTARQDMFPSRVASYQDPVINNQLGSRATPAVDNFDEQHPLYQAIRSLAELREEHEVFARGAQLHRYASQVAEGDIYAFSRILKGENREYLVGLNSSPLHTRQAMIKTFHPDTRFARLFPAAPDADEEAESTLSSNQQGEVEISLPPLSYAVYRAVRALPEGPREAPEPTITSPASNFESGKFWVGVDLSFDDFVEVSFYVNEPAEGWRFIGRDHNPPFRVRYDSSHLPPGSGVDFKAVVTNYLGRSSSTLREGVKIENRLPRVTLRYENGNNRPSFFGITSSGGFIFPRPASQQGFSFSWPEGDTSLTFFFEQPDPQGHTFHFDKPIFLSLKEDVYPLAFQTAEGGLQALLYVNNRLEVAGASNDVGSPLPESLPHNPQVPSPLTLPLYIRGGMNGWGTGNELVYRGNYTFQGPVLLESGDVEYKFADANWSTYNFGAPIGRQGITLGANPGNLKLHVPPGQEGLYQVHFFAYPPLSGSDGGYAFYRLARD